MLWVCDYYKYFYPYSAGIDFRRQNLASTTTSHVEIPINDPLIPADKITRGGHNQAYIHIRADTTLGQNSFWHRTIPDWNSLPAAAIESKTVAAFKSQLVD